MESNPFWSRRQFVRTAILSQVALGTGMISIFNSCNSNEGSGKILSFRLQKILKSAINEIIPSSDGMPSASEVGGLNYLLKLLEQYPTVQVEFKQGLTELNKLCLSKFKMDFQKANQEQKIEILKDQEKNNQKFFTKLRDYTYESYYLNPKIWKLVGYEPHPSMSSGPIMKPFDEKLLDNVKKMPFLYRRI